jgi:hypothetical protein
MTDAISVEIISNKPVGCTFQRVCLQARGADQLDGSKKVLNKKLISASYNSTHYIYQGFQVGKSSRVDKVPTW